PTPAPAPVQELNKPGESEKELIDRVLGRKKASMSDAPGGLAAGQQYAATDTTRVLLPGGQTAEFPSTMSQAEIEAAVRKFLGVPAPPPPKPQEQMPEGVMANIPGALKDTFGLSDRPGAVTLLGNEQTKPPLGGALNPRGPLKQAAWGAVRMARIARAGTLAAKALPAIPKTAAALGRIAAGTGLAAGKEAAKTGGVGWETVIDTAV